jgi:hypothetical protein
MRRLLSASGALLPASLLSITAACELLITEDESPTAPVITGLAINLDRANIQTTRDIQAFVDFTDADANVASIDLRVLKPDGSVASEGSVDVTAATAGLATGRFTVDLTVAPDVVGEWTVEGVLVDAAGQRSAAVVDVFDAQGFSDSQDACAATGLDCTGQGLCYNVEDTTCAYHAERNIPFDVCDNIEEERVVPTCVSSTTEPNSPLLTDENRCTFVQYWSNPTSLPIDCRCPEAQFSDRCIRPGNLELGISFAEGPRMRDLTGQVRAWRGTVVGREWFLPVAWGAGDEQHQTMIFAINLDIGDRRHVSGTYPDPRLGTTEVGSGDPFVQVMDLALHTDGKLYGVGATSDIADPKLWRIDPTTGERELIFDAATAAESELCPNFSTLPGRRTVQMTPEGWAMDAQGRHYFSMVNIPGPSILRLTIDENGTRCEYLTRVNDCPTCSDQSNVGTGFSDITFDMRAFHIEGNTLYTVSDTKLIAVDLTTGSRALLSNGKSSGGLGSGPINAEALGDRWTSFDPFRNVLWTVGVLGGSHAVAVDLDSGDRFIWPCDHPTLGFIATCNDTGKALLPGPLGFGGMVIDPEPPHHLFFAHDLFSVVEYDPTTGNAYTFSL